MWLALETSGDALSVAVGWPGTLVGESVAAGVRVHAEAILPMIDAELSRAETTVDSLTGLVLANGPGSFTGLRIGASVAKALARAGTVEFWTAPSLLALAVGAGAPAAGPVLAVTDALRGDVYAAMYRFLTGRVEVILEPGRFDPKELTGLIPQPAVVAGPIPADAARVVADWATGAAWRPEARPRAGSLIRLLGACGGATRIAATDVSAWQPTYGRDAEAQARWEREHGRPLAHPRR